MLVKKSGLGLLNPVTSENKKYLSFQRAIKVMEEGAFYNDDHLMALRKERRDVQKNGMKPTTPN